MSGISSSVGLVSGIPTGDLIDQLMAIEARSRNAVQTRIAETETVKAAWMSLSAGVLGVSLSATAFEKDATFSATSASSSNESVINAVAQTGATPGTYQFTVKRLAQNHQLISTGYADSTSLLGAGTMTFDIARGRLNPQTNLDFLNGQAGVRRGSIRITDRAGVTADIDMIEATTVADVIDAINSEVGLGVTARVSGDSIVLDDSTGLAGDITVAEVGNGAAAEDLGLLGSVTNASLVGSDVNSITTSTSLDLLNDGLGIERSKAVDDLAVTLRDGTVFNINLYGAVGQEEETAYTVGDVIDRINNAEESDTTANGGRLVASLSADGNGITLIDTTGGGGDLIVADGAGSSAATQLGLAGTYSGGGGDLQVNGRSMIASLNSVLLRNLQGGAGVTTGTLDLRDRLDNAASIDLSGADSLSDVIEAINSSGVGLTASLNDSGTALQVIDTTGSTDFHMVVSDSTGDLAATLGIAIDADSTEIVGDNAQHKYISTHTRLTDVNPAEAWAGGKIEITNTMGVSVEANFSASNVSRIEDVIQNINAVADVIGVTARINDSGTGLILEDSNGGAAALTVADVDGGKSARVLGISGSAETGEAFIDGSFRQSIDIEATDTLADLASKINEANMGVSASIINDGSSTNPYRLVLLSESTGRDGEIILDAGAVAMTMTTFSEARDALVYLGSPGDSNALALTSSDNQLSDFIEGVTFDLTGTDDNPVTVTITRDTDAITSAVDSFVSSFNGVIENISDYTRFNPDTLERGVLFGDSNASLLRSRLLNMAIGSVDLESGTFTKLSDIGVTLTTGNKLAFNKEKFLAAFETDRASVINLFTEAAQTREVTKGTETTDVEIPGLGGLGANFTRILEGLTDDYDGFITNVTESLDSRILDMNDRIEQINVLLESKRQRYERQFAAMELAIAEMQSQTGALNSLATMAAQFSASRSR